MQLPNWVEAAITFWGAAYAGAVAVPIVHFYGPKEVGYILQATKPTALITADRFGRQDYLEWYDSLLGGDLSEIPWYVVGTDQGNGLPGRALPFTRLLDADPVEAPARVDPNSPAIISFTSGTTRDPKGVIHSHQTIGFEARQLHGLNAADVPPPITGAPVGHLMGLNALLVGLLGTNPITLLDVWDPSTVLRMMLQDGLGISGGSTYFLTSLLDHPDFTEEHLVSMPVMGLGGSSVPPAVARRATSLGIKVFRAYGSTEHPSITGSFLDEPEVKRLTTDGHPLLGCEIRLDEDGEIWSRGPELFLGYTNSDLTATVFDSEGWYRTGDVGVLDSDGYLTITDRISDVIIRGGENISAPEVEELLLGMEAMAEVSVVAEPDARLGEHAAAIIRIRDRKPVPTLEQMRDHLAKAGLARQKWPEAIYVVNDFPRTASGKVQKFRLREQLRSGRLENGV